MAVVANKRSVMTMYSDAKSPYSHRVRMVLAEKNITVEIVDTDPVDISEDIMDLNPYGTLPTLVDRELVLFESRIIMEYLDERFPHPPLLPVDPVSRAGARLFMHRVDQDWYGKMDDILAGGKGVTKARKELRESLIAAAPIFAHKPYFMSDDFSLVDCAIAPLLWRLPQLGIELPIQAKAVEDYAARLYERDSFKESLTESEREMRE
ncbi:MAG: stringent starvation protein SspA [Candidatus Sedimenticola sp. (ex Thyasira tokunagai)]